MANDNRNTSGSPGSLDPVVSSRSRADSIIKDILDNHLPRIIEGLKAGYVDENQILVVYDHAVRARVLKEHDHQIAEMEKVRRAALYQVGIAIEAAVNCPDMQIDPLSMAHRILANNRPDGAFVGASEDSANDKVSHPRDE